MIDSRFYVRSSETSLKNMLSALSKDILVSYAGEDVSIQNIASLTGADKKSLTFCASKKFKDYLSDTKACACFVTEDLVDFLPPHTLPLVTSHPRVAFALISRFLYTPKVDATGSKSACHEGAVIHDQAFVSPSAEIGKNTVIYPHAYIGPGVVIGDHCHIHAGAVVEKTVMGHHVTVKSGAVIGQNGFGFEQYKGQLIHVPHMGRVKIGNHVSIGANTCIDRGALEDTVIEDYVQIDNLVQVAHNVHLGAGVILVSQVGIAGSTEIGAGSILAGQAGLADHLKIGKNVKIAAQSGVVRNIKDGQTVGGSPSVPIEDWHRQTLFLAKSIKK